MLSKVYSGHSFYHACRYIVDKPGAEVLEYDGVRGHDYKLMADDFMMQQQSHASKERACFHCSLSFYPGEILSNELMATIAKEYLDKLGIINTQFAITKHTDRKHMHLHVVANMVDNRGKVISDSYLGLRGKKIAQQLTKQYNLVPAEKKNIELTNHEALRKSEANKYKIYYSVVEALPHCRTMNDLEKRLRSHSIDIQYKYKGQTSEVQGISFKLGDYCFKGSKVDRQFSWSNLERTLAINEMKASRLLKPGSPRSGNELLQKHRIEREALGRNIGEHHETKFGTGIGKRVEDLMRPEETNMQTPHELIKESKRKKKQNPHDQNRGLHL